jgi:putative hydrolase of the HAD superfamily
MANPAVRAYAHRMIEAVLFDLDQTLLDRKSSLNAYLGDQWERFGHRLGKAPLDLWRDRFFQLDTQGMVHKSKVYPQLLSEFGGDVALSATLVEDYVIRSSEYSRGFPGMASTLEALRAKGLRLAIVTNGETGFQSRNIAALGLSGLVDEVLISQSEGLRKPDVHLFLRAVERLGTHVSKCMFVGDNPVADVLSAHAAGMQTAWFGSGQPWPADIPPNPGAAIETLPQVLELVGIRQVQRDS